MEDPYKREPPDRERVIEILELCVFIYNLYNI